MPVSTLSQALDNLYTTTWQNMKNQYVDQIFEGSPFWFLMKKNGMLESVAGGSYITEPLRYVKSERVQFIGKGGTVQLSDQEILTVARYDWKYLVDSIVRFGTDDQKNRGKNKILSFMNAKLENSRDSLADKMEEVLFGQNAATALSYLGLQDIIKDVPTSGTVGGIDQAVNTWWQSRATDMTGLSFATLGQTNMRTMMNDCSKNLQGKRPDLIMSGQTPYERYEDSVLEQKRIVNQTLGDAGFQNIQFKGTPMVWSPACANTRMYFLNTSHLKFVYDPAYFMDMTEWKPIPDQVNDRAAQIITAGELVSGRLSAHGVMYDLDTA